MSLREGKRGLDVLERFRPPFNIWLRQSHLFKRFCGSMRAGSKSAIRNSQSALLCGAKALVCPYWHILAVLLFCSFCAGPSPRVEAVSNFDSTKDKRTTSPFQGIDIGSICRHPGALEGKKVRVRGRYLGWRGEIENPRITRSDWAIEDDSGAIYVTGLPAKGLDPVRDIGHRLEVLGIVQVNPKGIPYIRAARVLVLTKE